MAADLSADLSLIFRNLKEKRTLPDLHAAQRSRKSPPPNKTSSAASGIASPHNKICTFCREEQEHRTHRALDHLLRSEALLRQRIADDESRIAIAFRDEHLQLKSSTVRAATTESAAVPRRVPGAEVIALAEQVDRRAIDENQSAEFDDAAACFRLTLRQALQKFEVAERTKKRMAQENCERKAKELSTASAKHDLLVARQRAALEDDEARARAMLCEIEATVAARMTEVAFTTRRDIRQHEARVEAMMQKHVQRLEMLDAELARVIFEENAARERHCAAERKAFEGTVCMEPDLKKRAAAHTKLRQTKETKEKQQLTEEELNDRQSIAKDEADERATFDQLFIDDAAAAVHREARRHVRNKRRTWREAREQEASEQLFAEENRAWLVLQQALQTEAFANPVPFEEASSRASIAQDFAAEYEWIDDLLLERELTLAQFIRQASELQIEALRDVVDESSSFSVAYSEIVARVALEECEAADAKELTNYKATWAREADICGKHPCLRAMEQRATGDFILTADVKAVFTTHVNATPIDVGAIFRLLPPAGKENIGALLGAFITVRVVNSVRGDTLTYHHQHATGAGGIIWDHEQDSRTPFAGVTFSCRSDVANANLLQTRVLEFSLCSVKCYAHVVVQPPHRLTTTEADTWTTLAATPLNRAPVASTLAALLPFRNVAFTPPAAVKSTSLGAYIVRAGNGRFAELKVVPPYKHDVKHASITKSGTTLCKNVRLSDLSVEATVEKGHFDEALECLEACVLLHRGDSEPTETGCTLRLDCLLTDGTHSIVEEELSWRYDVGRNTCIALPSFLTVRSACRPQESDTMALCTSEPSFPFGCRAGLEFSTTALNAPGRGRVVGGTIDLELAGTASNFLVMDIVMTKALQDLGWDVDGNKLLWRDKQTDNRREVARLTGRKTVKLRCDFLCHAKKRLCPTPAAMTALVRHVGVYTSTPVAGNLSENIELIAQCDLNVDGAAGITTTRTSVRINPAQLLGYSANSKVANAATDLGLTYVEGAQPKPLPAFADITAPPGGFGLGARLRVEFMSGCEEGDDLSVADACMVTEGIYQLRSKNAVIGWWRQKAGCNNQLLDFNLTADHGFIPTRQGEADDDTSLDKSQSSSLYEVPIWAPYTAASLVETSNLSSAYVMLVLRAIRYRCDAGPKVLKKVMRVTFDDGRIGRSYAVIHVKIDNIDEPTSVIFESPTVSFSPLSAVTTSNGVPIMRNVRLEDEDSDNFHEGFISLELVSPAPGDQLGLLDVEGQIASIYGGKVPAPSIANIIRSHFDPDTVPATEPPTLYGLPLLLTLYHPPLLRQYGDRLFFKGESIGTITSKASAANIEVQDAPKVMHRIDFFAESRFVPFYVAEHVLRCFTFDNKSLKPKPQNRKIELRLTPASTVTAETITVTVSPPTLCPLLLTAPLANVLNLSVTIEDSVKPKPLLPSAIASVAGDVLHAGYFHATLLDPIEKTEELLFDGNSIKLKEKSVIVGKDVVGIMQHPRVAVSDLYLIFSKVNSDSLTTLARALSIKGAIRPGVRRIQVRCCVNAADTNASQFVVNLVIPAKARPPTVTAAVGQPLPPLSLGSELSQSYRPLTQALTVTPGSGNHFLPGSQVIATIQPPCGLGDLLALSSTSVGDVAVNVKLNTRAAPIIDVYLGDVRVAKCPASCLVDGNKFIVGPTVSLTIVTEATAAMVQHVLSGIVFMTWNQSIRGTEHRTINVRVRERTADQTLPAGASPAALTLVPSPTNDLEGSAAVTFDIIPQLFSMSTKPVHVPLRSFDSTPAVLQPKLCISSAETDFVEATVELVDATPTETLSVDLTAHGDFVLDGQTIKSAAFTIAVKEGGRGKPRKTAIGSIMTPVGRKPGAEALAGLQVVQARFSPITASTESALVAWLESHRLSSTAAVVPTNTISVCVTLKTNYATCKCAVPLVLKESPSSAAASRTFSR